MTDSHIKQMNKTDSHIKQMNKTDSPIKQHEYDRFSYKTNE